MVGVEDRRLTAHLGDKDLGREPGEQRASKPETKARFRSTRDDGSRCVENAEQAGGEQVQRKLCRQRVEEG